MSYWRLQIQTGQKAGMPKSEVAKLAKLFSFLLEQGLCHGMSLRATELREDSKCQEGIAQFGRMIV